MNTAHSSNQPELEYQPTIIESRTLIRRLAIQIAFFRSELSRTWIDCNRNPLAFCRRSIQDLFHGLKRLLREPNVATAGATALVTVLAIVTIVLLLERSGRFNAHGRIANEEPAEVVLLDLNEQRDATGIGGQRRVGFNNGKGEGSGPKPKPSSGGGGGGDRNPIPQQTGKLPPPSNIQAAIPTQPPLNPPALPVAGIDIDPALWRDIKAPVFGDPTSKSTAESKGPGEGDGIGTGKGLGVGKGEGPGVGLGKDGNIGGDSKDLGCCGSGGRSGEGNDGILRSSQVEQRARLLSKPEPKYTEEARRNQISGTVMLRVVFASSGEVVQIRALNTLPFGLTERAIAAAREIKFVPATKGGRPVSVFMQLEYNFNLY